MTTTTKTAAALLALLAALTLATSALAERVDPAKQATAKVERIATSFLIAAPSPRADKDAAAYGRENAAALNAIANDYAAKASAANGAGGAAAFGQGIKLKDTAEAFAALAAGNVTAARIAWQRASRR